MADSRQTRSTLRDFLASRGSSANQVTLSPNPGDTGPTDAINEGDDLGIDPNTGDPILGLDGLASAYVAYLTQQAGNLYDLTSPGETAPSADRGVPIQPPDQQGASRVFARPGSTLGQAMRLSNSGRQDQTDYPIISYLDKTGADPARSGDSLLSTVQGRALDTTGNPQIDTYVDVETQSGKMQTGVLQSVDDANRTSPQRAAIPVGTQAPALDSNRLQGVQRTFGEHQRDNSATAQDFSYDQVKQVGGWLLASAAGYTIDGNTTADQFFQDTRGGADQTIRGAAARLGTKLTNAPALDYDRVRPSDAAGFPKQPDGTSMRQDRGAQSETNSDAHYTRPTPVTYTAETPFSDTTIRGNARVSQARALLAIDRLAQLLKYDDIVQVPADDKVLKSLGPFFMGGSIYSRINSMNRMITNVILVPTRNDYRECVEAGMGVMLGKKRGGTGTAEQIDGYFGAMSNSPGFWDAIAESAVDIIKKQTRPTDTVSAQYYIDLGHSKAVKVMNVFATVGDIVLQVTGKKYNSDTIASDIKTAAGVDSVDDLPVTAGTRISKSREGSGRSPLALSWRNNSLPGLYMLSDDVVRAAIQMGNLATGENPARGMLASSLIEKTYTDPNMKGDKARIPGDIVKIVEDKLDAEYVPFYFHDLRTNEIISFHAFLEGLSDAFGASFTSFKSYGRADPVQMYSSTTRTVSLSFTVAATSRDDFDEMWYKLNRLIACVYPKYTPGQLVKGKDVTFEQPFSQVIGATPLMRLRVGDVVRSNYSRFNLARFFGIGSEGVDVSGFGKLNTSSGTLSDQLKMAQAASRAFGTSSVSGITKILSKSIQHSIDKTAMSRFYFLFGSPIKTIASFSGLGNTNTGNVINTAVTNAASNFLVNGFVNPIGYGLMTAFTQNPDNSGMTDLESLIGLSDINKTQNAGYMTAQVAFIKPRERAYDVVDDAGNVTGQFIARRSLRVIVLGHSVTTRADNPVTLINNHDGKLNPIGRADDVTRETRYKVKVIDPSQFLPKKRDGATEGSFNVNLSVTHDDLLPDLGVIFSPAAFVINPLDTVANAVLGAVDSAAALANLNATSIIDDAMTTGTSGFMSPSNNAVVKAFENNKGRGLAGVIKQLSFSWLDFNWETDWGARAPMGTKVTISFDCIHDLPPGLDSSGYMRAPTHNVGSVMNTIGGDPHEDGGVISRQTFSREGASNVVKRK